MSDTFGIVIKVDDGNAESKIKGITGELGKAEAAGKKAGDGISEGARKGSTAIDQMKDALKGVAAGMTAAFAFHKVLELDEAFTKAQNSLRKFFDSDVQLNAAMGMTSELALQLHVNLGEAADAFNSVAEASGEMYLTTKEQIDITRTLGEVMKIDGHSIGDAAGLMKQLQYSMSVGTLTARELKTMMKEFPDIADIWTAKLGMTRKELLDMASNGKINSAMIREMVLAMKDGDAVHAKYSERVVTLNEQINDLTNRGLEPLTLAVGRYQAKLDEANEPVLQLVNSQALLHDSIAKTIDLLQQSAVMGQVAGVEALMGKTQKILDKGMKSGSRSGGAKQWFDDSELRGLTDDVVKQLEAELGYHEVGVSDLKGVTAGEIDTSASDALQKLADDMRSGAIAEATKKWNEELAESRKLTASIVEHLKPVEDFFVTMATTGKMEWSKMIDSMIADLTRLAVRQLEMAAIGALFGGGGTSLAAVSGGGHAFGGSYLTPGIGGQDSVPVMFRLTPGERVDFTPPGGSGGNGQAAQSQAPAPARTTIVEDRRDQRALAGGPEMDRVVIDVFRRHPQLLRR